MGSNGMVRREISIPSVPLYALIPKVGRMTHSSYWLRGNYIFILISLKQK